jgi:gliding motility-associated-like protein
VKKGILFLISFCFSCCIYGQLLKPGMAVFTQGRDAANLTDSIVIKIADIRNHSSAPVSNNWAANFITPSASFLNQWKYTRLGNIFSLAIDDSANFYTCATRMYGTGSIGAQFFGTAGAGGIYKFNAVDGKVYDFITTDNSAYYQNTPFKIPNKGCSLGDICFDYLHRQLFVSNFEDGKIYRISMNGEIKSLYDPFSPDDSTAGFAPVRERIYGLGFCHFTDDSSALYFARWGSNAVNPNQIWSVLLNPQTGDFQDSARLEFNIPSTFNFFYPVSDMAFSGDSLLVLAERGSPHNCRQLTLKKTGTWMLEDHNALGVYGTHDNSAGGIDLGYESFSGDVNNSVKCDAMIWCTGNALKFAGNNPDGSGDRIYGMEGYGIAGTSSIINAPDYYFTHSVFLDFDNNINNIPKGFIGDVEIYRPNCRIIIEIPPDDSLPDDSIPDDSIPEPQVCLFTNIVTPNGDYKNDFLNFQCLLPDMQLKVFNRWGNLMYQNANYKNDWSPTNLVNGVYYYILKLPDHDPVHGFFGLIK